MGTVLEGVRGWGSARPYGSRGLFSSFWGIVPRIASLPAARTSSGAIFLLPLRGGTCGAARRRLRAWRSVVFQVPFRGPFGFAQGRLWGSRQLGQCGRRKATADPSTLCPFAALRVRSLRRTGSSGGEDCGFQWRSPGNGLAVWAMRTVLEGCAVGDRRAPTGRADCFSSFWGSVPRIASLPAARTSSGAIFLLPLRGGTCGAARRRLRATGARAALSSQRQLQIPRLGSG